jgi:chaperone required for assembly of F1-ATPase
MDTQFCDICDNHTPVVIDEYSDETCKYCYDAYSEDRLLEKQDEEWQNV